jgi:hypothetical protein
MPQTQPIHLLTAPALLAALAAAQGVVSPNDRALYEGSSSTSYPLGRFDARHQQIHADVAGPAGMTISQHAYRRDAITERGEVTAFTAEVEVVLSAAARTPDAASRTFADNHGPNPVTVLNRTRLSFPTTTRPGSDPAPTFEHRIPYGIPFQLPAGAPLCLDVSVFSNLTSRGPNLNFSAYLDAHDLSTDGSVEQPGFVVEVGCPASGSSTPHDARFAFARAADGSLALDVRSRFGVPSTSAAPALTALIVGMGPQPLAWPTRPECRIHPAVDVTWTLPGSNDSSGAWSGALAISPALPAGQRFLVQLASGSPAAGDITFSDTSLVTVPPPGPTVLSAVRIASGSDHSASTGTLSRNVTVVEFR